MKDYLEKRREELSKREEGFTLMEMLIVVAIIAVLIAIAIPIFTSQLENSRESTDAANLRSAYAEVAASGMLDQSYSGSKFVSAQQREADWSNKGLIGQNIGDSGNVIGSASGEVNYTSGQTGWTVSWNPSTQRVSIAAGSSQAQQAQEGEGGNGQG